MRFLAGTPGKFAVAIAALVIAFAGLMTNALAVHDLGLFELDGNTTTSTSHDWDQVYSAYQGNADHTGSDKSLFVQDQNGAGSEINFASGADKDNNDVSAWDWSTDPTLAKDDIADAGAAIYTSGSDTIAYFFLDRISAGTGDADVGFWFFKGFHNLVPSASDPTKGTFSGQHQIGDVLVVSEFTNGGGVSKVNVFKWVGGTAGDDTHLVTDPNWKASGPLQLEFQGVDCRVTGAGDTACATVNEGTQTFQPQWPYTNSDGNSTYELGAFFEGGVNLTALGLDIGCGGTFLADTRASQSTDARLHDFAMGDLSLCSADISTTPHTAAEANIAEGAHVALGTDVHDSATVTKHSGTPVSALAPTGNVAFRFYTSTAACTADTAFTGGTAKNLAVPLVAGYAHPSDSTGALGAGTYAFRAEYLGDSNYAAVLGGCETFVVDKAELSLTTAIHSGSSVGETTPTIVTTAQPLGSTVHDSASVSGIVTGFAPANNVTFTWFTNGTCANTGTAAGSAAISSGVAHPSNDEGPLGAGSYSFMASLAGDSNYTVSNSGNSACEPLTINKAPSTTATELHTSTEAVVASGGEAPADGLPTMHDKATVSGTVGAIAMTGSVSFRFYGTIAACTADTGFTGGTPKGTITIDSNGVAHPSDSAGPLGAGNYAFKAQYSGDANYLGSTSDCETFYVSTITLIKDAKGPGATFTFDITGPSPSTKTITTTTNPDIEQNGPFTALSGSGYSVSEETLAGWTLTDITCTAGSGGADTNGDGIPNSWTFDLTKGTNVTCTFTNSAVLTTRTQGFWATHTGLANAVWNGTVGAPVGSTPVIGGPDEFLCGRDITAIAAPEQNILMGGFWSNIAKTTTGDKRSSIDQARMQLLQQYLAAVLNVHAFGSGSEAMLATARDIYCNGTISQIKAEIGVLGTFNTGGDSQAFTPGSSATAQESKLEANLIFWDATQ